MVSAQLLRRLVLAEETSLGGYIFKHVLTQEAPIAPCRTASSRSIAVLPSATSKFLLTGWTHAAMLAYHFAEAGDQVRALSYSLRAGDHGHGVYAVAEARCCELLTRRWRL
ncbi:MAG: hypothetical protein R2844_19895 [Caldilineales bacterium]